MMARVFLRCVLLALVELVAFGALCWFLWRKDGASVVLTLLAAGIAGGLLGPTPDERAALDAFIKQQGNSE